MDQDSLFHEDFYDALGALVGALGGKMTVGIMLRPELKSKPGYAESWVKDCVNRNNKHDFKPEQVLLLLSEARKVNCHAGMWFINDACDYKRSEPVQPETEMMKLSRDILQMGKQQMLAMEKYEHLVDLHNKESEH